MSTSEVTAPPRRRIGKRALAAAAIVVAAVAVGGMLYLQTWPPIATVMSASMTPAIKTGDVVLLGRLGRPARVGDIVEVNVPDAARTRYGYPPVVIHRIVSIAPNGQVQTKGDARQQKDPFTVNRRGVTARVVATIPAAGRIFAFLVSPLGLIWLVAGAVLLLGMPLLENRRDREQREQQTLAELRAELQAMSAQLRTLTARREIEPVVDVEPEMPLELEPEPEPEPEPLGPAVVTELLVEHVPEFDPFAAVRHAEEREVPAAELADDIPIEWVLRVPDVAPRRRSGGLVGSVERYARSLSSRYR